MTTRSSIRVNPLRFCINLPFPLGLVLKQTYLTDSDQIKAVHTPLALWNLLFFGLLHILPNFNIAIKMILRRKSAFLSEFNSINPKIMSTNQLIGQLTNLTVKRKAIGEFGKLKAGRTCTNNKKSRSYEKLRLL